MTAVNGQRQHSPGRYADLSPDCVLDAVESVGLEVDGRLLELNSLENRVYQVGLEDDGFVVVKFYRPGRWTDAAIEEEHAFTAHLLEHELPVVSAMRFGGAALFTFKDFRFSIFPRQGGREPELESEDNLAWLGRTLGRLHGAAQAFPFKHRIRLLDAERVRGAALFVDEAGFVPPHLTHDYRQIADGLLEHVTTAFAAPAATQSIHGDCHRGNVLWTEQGPWLVDLDDCVTGPVVADFWMLLDGDPQARNGQLAILVEAYEDFCDFDWSAVRLIEPLRAARMMEYAAWIAHRWPEPAFVRAFPWFDQPRYWEDHLASLNQQLLVMNTS